MKEKNSKRVVIIDDIDSCMIEQAILILRRNGAEKPPKKTTIVSEAERIIHAYAKLMEKNQHITNRKERHHRRKNAKQTHLWISFACFLAAGMLIATFFHFPFA